MTGWSNPEVTPVGPAGAAAGPGAGPPTGAPGPGGMPADPFGSRPSGRRRGRVRLALGLLVIVAGAVATTVAVVGLVSDGSGLADRAVAEGAVGEGVVVPAAFTAPEAGDYTVYAHFDGFFEEEENRRDRTIADIDCDAARPDGSTATIRGSRQGASQSIGSNSTIGWFSTPAGDVTVTCRYRRTVGSRADQVELLVVEGRPSVTGVLAVFVGIAALVVGLMVAVWGWSARRRRG